MANLPKISPLLWILVLIGIQINANPITNDTIENDSSWLTQWQKCFFNDASEDVGHFFLTRLINCCPLTTPMTTSTTSDSSSCIIRNRHVNKLKETSSKNVNGWNINMNVFTSTTHDPLWNNYGKCKNLGGPDDFWVGRSGDISTTLHGCGHAKLDIGNCDSGSFKVKVYIDGRVIGEVPGGHNGKIFTFEFKEGSDLTIHSGNGIVKFNNFEVIDCYTYNCENYEANVFLIAGGSTPTRGRSNKDHLMTEAMNLDSKSNMAAMPSFGEIPSLRESSVGGLLGTTPIICGGYDDREIDQDSCFTYNQQSTQWTKTHTMTTKRYSAGSVQLNATTLWIVGGGNEDDWTLASSEFVGLDSSIGNPGPLLPDPLAYSCVVKYSENEVFVIGGSQLRYLNVLNKVLIFNPMNGFTHFEGPSLITKRSSHSCGLMSNGQQSKIVVAGGISEHGRGALSSVEIYDSTTNNWISGPPLPYSYYYSAMATSPDGRGVILFGGYSPDKDLILSKGIDDTLLELRYGSDEWITLTQKLKQPRRDHVVIPISTNTFTTTTTSTIAITTTTTSTGCSNKVKVGYAQHSGYRGAHKARSNIYEYYYAQSGTVGGKMHYKSSNGKYSIWYHESRGKWYIGKTGSLGGTRSYASVKSSAECPYGPAYTWRYYHDKAWHDADKTLSIWKKS